MKRFLIGRRGNAIYSVSVFAAILFCLMFLFSIVVSKSTINLIIHEAKSDLYLINRNAIFAIQHELMGEDIESLHEEELGELIKKGMRNSWGLDKNLRNGDGIIKSAKIDKVLVLEDGDRDNVTGKMLENLTVHTVVKINIMPIIFNNVLKEQYEFSIHEDFKIQKMNLR